MHRDISKKRKARRLDEAQPSSTTKINKLELEPKSSEEVKPKKFRPIPAEEVNG